MHFITVIKIKKYNLFYKYIQIQNRFFKYIQLQNRIYFTNLYNLFFHTNIYNIVLKYIYKAVYSFYIHTCKHLVTIGMRFVENVCSET